MLLSCLLAATLLVQAALCSPQGVRLDPPAKEDLKDLRFTIGTSEYLFLTTRTDWYKAKLNCKAQGMELVSIESAEENAGLTAHLQAYPYEEAWTSGTRLGTHNNYYWESTGNFFGPYKNWLIPPEFYGDEEFVYLQSYETDGSRKWRENSANYPTKMAICELRPQTYDTSIKNKPGRFTIGDGYYEISSMMLPWQHAKNDCRSRGMDLLSIETEEENAALISALQEYEEPFWTSGNRYLTQDYYWEATGQLIEGTYTNWAAEQPSIYPCVKMNADILTRQWYTEECYIESNLARYVCEFHPRE
ncbi:Hypothetical predicted protein [Cloeon dipterum]|uniref:C-type lectin domain-containing protein n=1 Tax=Cloeon dipterum TaxID=197152 RepID=A0A8S1CEH4_9INSE|nr:Hypothetical predicted protein [Cloeon dipterum]